MPHGSLLQRPRIRSACCQASCVSVAESRRGRGTHAARREIVLCARRPGRARPSSPGASATLPGVRTASGCVPILHAMSESPPRYSTLSTRARTPRSKARPMCSGRTPSMPPAHAAGSTAGPPAPAMIAPPSRRLQRQQVHRRRADEARDECVRGPLVQLDRRAVLLDAPAVQQDHPVGHRHRLDLVVRHVHHRDAELALQRPDLQPHFRAQLGVEVRQRLVHQADRRLVDDRAAQARRAAAARRRAATACARAAPSARAVPRRARAASGSPPRERGARAARTGCSRQP